MNAAEAKERLRRAGISFSITWTTGTTDTHFPTNRYGHRNPTPIEPPKPVGGAPSLCPIGRTLARKASAWQFESARGLMDLNAKLQKLTAAIGKHGCPTCRGCTIDPKTKEACKGCGGTGKGIDWAQRIINQ